MDEDFSALAMARVLNFACRDNAKKAKNVGHTKATKLNLRTMLSLLQHNPFFHFYGEKKVRDR